MVHGGTEGCDITRFSHDCTSCSKTWLHFQYNIAQFLWEARDPGLSLWHCLFLSQFKMIRWFFNWLKVSASSLIWSQSELGIAWPGFGFEPIRVWYWLTRVWFRVNQSLVLAGQGFAPWIIFLHLGAKIDKEKSGSGFFGLTSPGEFWRSRILQHALPLGEVMALD